MSTVNVSGLAATTSKSTLEHFFSFCGKIESVEHEGTTAKVVFHKEGAAKTALMLNGGTLDGSTISVTSDDVKAPAAASATSKPAAPAVADTHADAAEISQEDKPRSAIVAEYLAHGYTLGDHVVERAINTDKQYGISDRFLSWFNPLATKVQGAASPHIEKAQAKFQQVDEKQGISLKASAAATIGSKYYNQALASPFGSKVHAFYTQAEKQVRDVHEEALRIKESKKASGTTTPVSGLATGPSTTSTTAPTASTGTAEPGSTQPTQTSNAPVVPTV